MLKEMFPGSTDFTEAIFKKTPNIKTHFQNTPNIKTFFGYPQAHLS